jgi:drug/metabolite transporter (DMT)-like permease
MRRFFSNCLSYFQAPSYILGVIIGSSFIGASPIFVRLSTLEPFAIGFFRFFIALPFLWLWMVIDTVVTPDPKHPTQGKEYLLVALAGLCFALDIATWHHSLNHTSIVNSTLLNNMTPIFVTLIAWLALGEKLTALALLGVILALIGTFFLVLGEGQIGEFNLLGDSLALLSALFFSGYVLIIKHLRSYFSAPTLMAWSSISCMYCLAFLMFIGERNIIPIHLEEWWPLIGLGIVVHTLGQGLIAISLKHLSASFSSITMLIAPMVSALLAWLIFQESFTLTKILGGIIIITGIMIARQNEKKI